MSFDLADKQDLSFVLQTLQRLEVKPGTLLHIDQVSVYTSDCYHQKCTQKGIIRSMSRKGTTADNTCIESFHSTLKSETFYLANEMMTKSRVIRIVSNYILHDNTTRIQQKLDFKSPVDFRLTA